MTALDDVTISIESDESTHVMDSVLAEWVFTIWMLDGSDYVFTGPYKVDAFVSGDHIDLVPNSYYPQASDRPDILLKKYASSDALATASENLEVDIGFHLPADSDTLSDVRGVDGMNVRTFEVGYHYMMFHNVGNNGGRAIDDVNVRQAIDLAVDRDAVSQALAGGHGTRSLFPDYTPWYQSDLGESYADESGAEALLDAAGWTLDSSTGVRMKGGENLTIDLVAYAFRPDLGTMQTPICDSLSAVGIKCNAIMTMDGDRSESDDWSEVVARLDEGDFDLLLWAQNTLPAGDPAWFLNAFFRSDGGSNHAGLNSSAVDALIDTMSDEDDHDARVSALADAHEAILDDMAVSNLVTPEWHVSLSDRMLGDDAYPGWDGYTPWGSDYYVIRADLFVAETTSAPTALDVDGAAGVRATIALAAAGLLAAALL